MLVILFKKLTASKEKIDVVEIRSNPHRIKCYQQKYILIGESNRTNKGLQD